MKNIVILIPWFYPAYKAGGPIQSIVNMVEEFSENISYKIICANTDLGKTALSVISDKWIRYNEQTEVWYASKKDTAVSIFKKELCNNFKSILFINGLYSWTYNLAPLLFCKASKKIVSVRGMLHPGALSQKKYKKIIYLFLWKFFRLHTRCNFHATNEKEKLYIKNIFGRKTTVFIAQNFPRKFQMQFHSNKSAGYLQLGSIALISPMKNHLIVLEALKLSADKIDYHIYGPVKDKIYWQTCLEKIKELPQNIKVIYYGETGNDKIEETLKHIQVFILPSKSENFGHAMYEALSAGKPLITSNNTPWNDLNKNNAGINVDPGNSNQLISAIEFFAVMNNSEFKEWCNGASLYAANAINIDNIKEQYHQMFMA